MMNTYHSLQAAMCKERNRRQCLGETLETVWEKYELQCNAIISKMHHLAVTVALP